MKRRWRVALAGFLLVTAPVGAQGCPSTGAGSETLRQMARDRFVVADAARDSLALALVACLSSEDPVLRDDIAFSALSTWLRGKQLDAVTVRTLGQRLLALVEGPPDDAGFRQPFAALGLAEVVRADRIDSLLPSPMIAQIAGAAVEYVEALRDYRAYDGETGWRHGVAHAADWLLQLGLHPRLDALTRERLLVALATQVAAQDGHVYVAAEPERLARAVFFAYDRGGLASEFWDRWLARIGDPAPAEHWGSALLTPDGAARRINTISFLQTLGLMARIAAPGPREQLLQLVDRELRRLIAV